MDFVFESLGDEKFQKFCQTLLIDLFPNLQCLPVGQPDGGRDAVNFHEGGQIVFQVKFSRNPSSKNEREALSQVIASESEKVKVLIKKGATAYYLLTNISGTSHLEVGSIDKLNEELTRAFGIPCHVWWRDDLERRLEASQQILWRYPELARGQDFLEFLAKEHEGKRAAQSAKVFASYLTAQYSKETDVKFQQVQIHSNLFDLFTDTPIGLAREKMPTRQALGMAEDDHQVLEATFRRYRPTRIGPHEGQLLAAHWLLTAAPKTGLQRIILEGAPGQGKSTVTQYLCQIHRSIALRKGTEDAPIPDKYLNGMLRLPMRVDLRDYALWLTGKDPLAGEKNVDRPVGSDDSLESLIAYQVHKLSGGKSFNVDSLTDISENSHYLLVLDGFNEVAYTSTRVKLIEQIKYTTERMSADSTSLQVIVTSRPSAFILSAGFPERDWAHVALLPMDGRQIVEYTDKWITARGVEPKEGKKFKELLVDRINRPHIRSLAQNPMQLTILLNLISTKGMSLPDKRTALYDSYKDLFFGREAEKSATVRENRDILFQIHQYVAWNLQLDAEVPGGTGSISQGELKKLVERYLIEKEHKGDVLKLFTGAVERVGALVSRVQGLLEFEVQPLREYFAGKFLYETAPYSPPGAERKGTKPQRFDALARRSSWSNVLRFYAGCYSSGELLSLVAGLEDLNDDADLSLKSHALHLTLLLLGDYVFAQEPRTVRKVVEFAVKDDNLRYLLAYRSNWEESRISLPEKCGRAEIAEKATTEIAGRPSLDYLSRLGALYRMNSSFDERWQFWLNLDWEPLHKLDAAMVLALFIECDDKHISGIIHEFGDEGIKALILAGRWNSLSLDEKVRAVSSLVNTSGARRGAVNDFAFSTSIDVALFRVYTMLSPNIYRIIAYNRQPDISLAHLLSRFGIFHTSFVDEDTSGLDERKLNDIVSACDRAIRYSIRDWYSQLAPWNDIIESARRTWGDTPRIITIACVAAGIKSKKIRASAFDQLLDGNLPLAGRARYARLRASPKCWETQMDAAHDQRERFLVFLLFLSWGSGPVIEDLSEKTGKFVDQFTNEEWSTLFSAVENVVLATS